MKGFTKYTWLIGILALFIVQGCAINKQARQIKVLEDCKYRIVGASQVLVAGTDVKKLMVQRSINFSDLPGVAVGLLTKDIPLKATFLVEITNPTQQTAAINEFEYKFLIGEKELANGLAAQPVSVAPGKSQTVPIQMNTNLYALLSDKNVFNSVMQAIEQQSGSRKLGVITFKLKPTINFAGTSFKYPGYLTINKEISSLF